VSKYYDNAAQNFSTALFVNLYQQHNSSRFTGNNNSQRSDSNR
jgi:hypothetical protein